MSVSIPCATIWDKVKNERVHQNVDWSGMGGKLEKWAAEKAGFDVDDTGINIRLGQDIPKLCPGTAFGTILSKMGKDLNTLACDGLNGFISKQGLSTALTQEIKSRCPDIINTCLPTICKGQSASVELKCQDIQTIFHLLLKDDSIVALLEKEIPFRVDLKKEDPCRIAQMIESLGIDVTNILSGIMTTYFQKMDLTLSPNTYSSIISCSCPGLSLTKPLDCEEVKDILDSVLMQNAIQKVIKHETGQSITAQNKCDVLQQLVDTGAKPEHVMRNALLGSVQAEYVPSEEKLGDVIKCLCPDLKPYTPNVDPDKPSDPGQAPWIYNKINIAVGFIVLLFFVLVLYFLFSRVFGVGKSLFVILLAIGVIILIALVRINPQCIFRSCIDSGQDWNPVEGVFVGSKSMLGINIRTELEIKKESGNNNSIQLKTLSCSGKTCPFSNLVSSCKDPNITLQKPKTVYGYALSGSCIEEVYKIQSGSTQIVKGLWLTQNSNKLTLNIKIEVPVVGIMFLTIPLEQK